MSPLAALERYTRGARGARPVVCELCGGALEPEHGHVVDVAIHTPLCACRACTLALDGRRAGRHRAVSNEVRWDENLMLTDGEWAALGVPVALALLQRRSSPPEWVALFPSPAGPVEAEPAEAGWTRVLAARPALLDLEPEVEALLVRRERTGRVESFVVPIDACYRLIGLVRSHWRGFDGGDEARAEVERFFEDLRRRAGSGP